MNNSFFRGTLFEGFVASEVVKHQTNIGQRREIYYFRSQQGLEIDFIIPLGAGNLLLAEVKSTSTPMPRMAKPLAQLATVIDRYQTHLVLVVNDSNDDVTGSIITPEVKVADLAGLLDMI